MNFVFSYLKNKYKCDSNQSCTRIDFYFNIYFESILKMRFAQCIRVIMCIFVF